jgi:hypothetical protein
MTDRQDCGSLIPSKLLVEMAARSDAVIQLVDYSGGGGGARYRVRSCTPRAPGSGVRAIETAAERTGGELHDQSRFFRSASIAKAFREIFDDFRQSYVLRYSPEKVPSKGWHAIAVTVPNVKDATVKARQGYYQGLNFISSRLGFRGPSPDSLSPVDLSDPAERLRQVWFGFGEAAHFGEQHAEIVVQIRR